MSFIRQYSVILGLCVLIGVLVLLLSSSDLMFSSGVTFIGTELHSSLGDETYVETKMDFGSQHEVDAFPLEVGDWRGHDEDTSGWAEELGADVAMLRGYVKDGVYQPIFLLIMQAKTGDSFHPPKLCYSSQGYDIQEDDKEQVLIKDASWAEEIPTISVPLEKLVVAKDIAEGIDRRLVLYFYLKGNQYTSDTITMIRLEASVPAEGSYEGILELEKELLYHTFRYMFEPVEEEDWNPIVLEMAGWGVGGYAIVVFLLCLPVAIFAYPLTRWGREPSGKLGLENDET